MLHPMATAPSAPPATTVMLRPSSPLGIIDFNGIAQSLGMSIATLERLVRKDATFPRLFKIGARRYARFDDLRDWVDQKARAA